VITETLVLQFRFRAAFPELPYVKPKSSRTTGAHPYMRVSLAVALSELLLVNLSLLL